MKLSKFFQSKIAFFALVFVLTLLVRFLIIFGFYFFDISPNNDVTDSLQSLSAIEKFLLGVIIAPVIEELIFRIGLKYSIINLSLAAILISYYISSKFYGLSIFSIADFIHERAFISLIIGTLVYSCLKYNKVIASSIRHFWEKFKFPICCFSILMFSYAHIDNFSGDINWFEKIMIALPYFALGIGITIVRMRIGILAAILFHALNNSLSYLT